MKTKEQKRQQAIERFRKNYTQQAQIWRSSQPGGHAYETALKVSGKEVAETLREEADEMFKRFQVHAEIDSHGNPLTTEEVFDLKSRTYTGFRGTSNNVVYPDSSRVGFLEYEPCNTFN